MTAANQGKLADKSLGELIREIGDTSVSGALRLSRDRAKAVVYFEKGALVFMASNIRAHRLFEFLKRSGLADDDALTNLSPKATDEEILDHFVKQGRIRPEQADAIRANHVTDILRTTLLWTEGEWQLDARVRMAGNTRVTLDTRRLLLESVRHLPAAYIVSRFADREERIEFVHNNGYSPNLLPAEGFVLSRVTSPMRIKELVALGGMAEDETLRAIYALAMAGLLRRVASEASTHDGAPADTPRPGAAASETLEDFLARAGQAANHYETLNVGRQATTDQIKNAYHALARRYHPDRFHRADSALRSKVESAFARIAHAYEILRDQSSRAAYDVQIGARTSAQPTDGATVKPTSKSGGKNAAEEDRAETSFKKGLAAAKQNQPQQALRFFAEAASLEPRRALYRAEYGRALTSDPQTRRLAEIELKAAIALETDNVSYRVALAELYKALGLRRRAEGELQRALIADPKNDAARKLLTTLKN
ncbi:MAG TPA: DnaJ domain-containing protein [Pyrinomonadaceae bacterium]|jgi:curved DNA-binding protein CbpA